MAHGSQQQLARFIPVLVSCIAVLQGCIGLAVGTYGKIELAKERFGLGDARNSLSFVVPEEGYTEAEVVSKWGEPDWTGTNGECTILAYEDGTSWAGVGAFVGVAPIGIGLPSGKYHNRIYVRNGRTVGLVQEFGDSNTAVGAVCFADSCEGAAGAVNEPYDDAKAAIGRWCE